MRIYFATWPEEPQAEALTICNASLRLASYYFINNAESPSAMIAEYVKNGVVNKEKKNG